MSAKVTTTSRRLPRSISSGHPTHATSSRRTVRPHRLLVTDAILIETSGEPAAVASRQKEQREPGLEPAQFAHQPTVDRGASESCLLVLERPFLGARGGRAVLSPIRSRASRRAQ